MRPTSPPPEDADVAAMPPVTLWVLCAVSVLMGVGFTGIQSLLPAIGRQLGVADSLVAGIFSLAAVLVMVFSPIWARQSDLRGRKPIILVGVAGFIVSMGGFALAVSAGIWQLAPPMVIFALLLATRGINGAVGAASQPATQAYVADHTTPDNRTQAMATIAGANGFGTILGPLIAPLLVFGWLGLAGPLYAFALAGGMMLFAAWRWLPDDSRARRERAQAQQQGTADGPPEIGMAALMRHRGIRPFLVYGAVSSFVGFGVSQTIGFAVIDLVGLTPIRALPYITGAMMVGAATTVAGQWGLIPLFRLRPAGLMAWGAGLGCIGAAAMVAAPHYGVMVAGFGLFSLGMSFARPGFTAGASLAVPSEAQGAAAGFIGAMGGAAPLLSPLFVVVYGAHHLAPFLISAAILGGLYFHTVMNRRLGDTGER